MNEKKRKDMVGVLVIRVLLCSHPIDILGAQTVFLDLKEYECKKRISISHILEWNFRFLIV